MSDAAESIDLAIERGSLRFELAGPEADAELQQLLRANAMPGRISLSLERSPSFFLGATIEGESHQTVVARERASGNAIGLCSRAVRSAFLNGEVGSLGYFSQLRVSEAWRSRRGPVQGGFALCQRLHDREAVPLYVTTIIEDNRVARRLLEAGLPGLPRYVPREPLLTFALPIWHPRRVAPGCEVRAARREDLPRIASFLTAQYARYQFAPRWSLEALGDTERCRGLAPEDFTLAFRQGELVGCVSLWDQEGFKQTVIRGYEPPLDRLRGGWNLFAPWLWPRLPAVGERLRHAYLAHLAIDRDDPQVCQAVLLAAANRSLERRYAYLTLGLAERHPLVPIVRRSFRHLTYRSMIYVVHWADGAEACQALDDRVPHLEVAVL